MSEIEKSLSGLNYEYKEIAPEIFIVKNFLKDEEISLIKKEIALASQEDWEVHYMLGVRDLAERKYGRTDIKNLVEEGLIEITNNWHDKNLGLKHEISEGISERIKKLISFDDFLVFEGVGTIQRQYAGVPLVEHVDNHADPEIEYAVIMYINDDYVDGELFFKNLELEIKPPAKSLIIFPSGEEYLHGVKPPGDGPLRYVLPSFVKRNDEYATR
jgi:hypothetical protein